MTVGNTSNISRRNYTKPGKTCGCLEWLCREVQISSCRYSKRSNNDVLVDLWKHHWQHPHCSTCIFLNSPSSIYIKHRTRLHFRAVPKLANSWQAFFVVFFSFYKNPTPCAIFHLQRWPRHSLNCVLTFCDSGRYTGNIQLNSDTD